MTELFQILKRYPIAIILFAIIWYLCFFTPPQTPLDNVKFIDKWVHITMYGGTCTVLWLEYLHIHDKLNGKKLIIFAVFAPILMSGLIEILQEYCTNGRRDGDWLDFAANSTGVILAAIIGLIVAKCRAKL